MHFTKSRNKTITLDNRFLHSSKSISKKTIGKVFGYIKSIHNKTKNLKYKLHIFNDLQSYSPNLPHTQSQFSQRFNRLMSTKHTNF